MHAERLLSIFAAIIEDDTAKNYSNHIQKIVAAIAARINEPQQPNHLTAIAENLKIFREVGKVSETNTFSLTWKKIIYELELEILLIEEVERRIDEVFRSTSMETEYQAELNKIVAERNKKKGAITQILEGFQQIGLTTEELDPGEIVLNFTIPRKNNEGDLKSFHKELSDLEKNLLWISRSIRPVAKVG